jgi:hypothetical protein
VSRAAPEKEVSGRKNIISPPETCVEEPLIYSAEICLMICPGISEKT